MNVEGPVAPAVTGPLAGFEAGFWAHLARLGYAPGSARSLVKVMARVSCWLEDQGLDVGGLTPPVAADRADARFRDGCFESSEKAARLMPLATVLSAGSQS